MRILLASLNAKYVHTNLALRYLREVIRVEFPDVLLQEFTINQSAAEIAAVIYEAKADVIGFSCYIWNLNETLTVIRRLRPVCPDWRFVLGGPEVSFETERLMTEHSEIDAVVMGEGERTFPELLRVWSRGEEPEKVLGLAWRRLDRVLTNPPRPELTDLDLLPDPYGAEESFAGRLVYVETSRGCPFSCAYCLSSTTHGVRFLSPERFRRTLRSLLQSGAETIKFVDRTFNARKSHAFRILDVVREEAAQAPGSKEVRVHCEIAGELLDEEWVNYLQGYPPGLLQLEIGVQSTHQPTLEIIRRVQNFQSWQERVRQIRAAKIPVHLDLIAGLPEESWSQFRQSFNAVYALEPDMLQLGFLKLLKGSGLRRHSVEYGLVYSPDPPYTILQTNALRHSELLQLRRMEELLNPYYNSGKFTYSLRQAAALKALTPFDFYGEMAGFWQERRWFDRQLSGKALFTMLWEFIASCLNSHFDGGSLELWRDALRLDYCLWERPTTQPDFLKVPEEYLSETLPDSLLRQEIFLDPGWLEQIPEMAGMDRRHWARSSAVAYFTSDVWNQLSREGTTTDQAERDRGIWYLFFYRQGRETRIFRVNR